MRTLIILLLLLGMAMPAQAAPAMKIIEAAFEPATVPAGTIAVVQVTTTSDVEALQLVSEFDEISGKTSQPMSAGGGVKLWKVHWHNARPTQVPGAGADRVFSLVALIGGEEVDRVQVQLTVIGQAGEEIEDVGSSQGARFTEDGELILGGGEGSWVLRAQGQNQGATADEMELWVGVQSGVDLPFPGYENHYMRDAYGNIVRDERGYAVLVKSYEEPGLVYVRAEDGTLVREGDGTYVFEENPYLTRK